MTEMACSVVIATRGEARSLEHTLRCLFTQNLPSDRYEVIVVDNNQHQVESEHLAEVVNRFPVRLVAQSVAGPAAARNAGIRAAEGEVVVFVDDDIETSADFLEAHLAEHARAERSAVVGRIVEGNSHSKWFLRYLTDRRVVNRVPDPNQVDFRNFYGANSSARRADLIEVGGFDENFTRREDADLGIRLMTSGLSFRYADRAVVHHHSSFGPLDHVRRSYWNGYFLGMLIDKHPDFARHENMSNYSNWKRWVSWLVGPPLVAVGVILYPASPRPLFKGLTALVLVQNSRGYRAFGQIAESRQASKW
jgi:GT2 family glycosyltransferase